MYCMSLSKTATFGTATLELSQGLRHLNGYELSLDSNLDSEGIRPFGINGWCL